MTVRLRIRRDGAERAIDLAAGEVTIGRAAGQALRLVEDGVAPAHAALHLGARWELEARGGEVELGGARLTPGERAPLPRGAAFVIAGWTLVADDAPMGASPAGAARTASLARELVRELLGGEDHGGGPRLEVIGGPATGQGIPLPMPPSRVVIGRGEDADVIVLDPDLSRRHAAFDRAWDGVRVVDLGSKNGTRVGRELAPTAEPGVLLDDGDEIAAGATVLRLRDPAEEYLRALDDRLGDGAAGPPRALTPPARAIDRGAETPLERPRPGVAAPPPVVARPGLTPVLLAALIAAAAVVALILLLV